MLDDHVYNMLDELNMEILKIKELFTLNKESDSFSNSHCFEKMSAGEDCVTHEMYSQQNSNIDKNSIYCKYYGQSVQYEDTDHYHSKCNNTSQQKTGNKHIVQGQTSKGFYQIPPPDFKEENAEIAKHFFTWKNPSVCQCGMIYNNK